MNEKINLCEILKDCPRGTKLYSTIHGEVQLLEVKESDNDYPIITVYNNIIQTFAKDGKFFIEHKDSECILFPSKDQRDWSKWQCSKPKKPKFDPKTLKAFQRVLARTRKNDLWRCGLFSFILDETCIYTDMPYSYCIPYNDDTKHLVGTSDEAPEYYRYWEE